MSLTSLGVNSQLKAVAITSTLKTTKKMRLQWGLYLSHNLPTFWKLSLKVTILKPLCELPVRPSFFFCISQFDAICLLCYSEGEA